MGTTAFPMDADRLAPDEGTVTLVNGEEVKKKASHIQQAVPQSLSQFCKHHWPLPTPIQSPPKAFLLLFHPILIPKEENNDWKLH